MSAKAPKKSDQLIVAVKQKTRRQLFYELLETAPEVTGTHSADVADRIIEQVANAQVWAEGEERK